jgi:hypothetical protein
LIICRARHYRIIPDECCAPEVEAVLKSQLEKFSGGVPWIKPAPRVNRTCRMGDRFSRIAQRLNVRRGERSAPHLT